MASETAADDSRPRPDSDAYVAGGRGDNDSQGADNAGSAADNNEDNGSSVGPEKTQEPQLTKKEKMKRHFRRFWYWYLIGGIIGLAIILPILFKVIIPAIVQNIVNGQELPVYGGILQAISPQQMAIELDTSLDTPLAATLGEMGLDFYNKGTEPYSPFLNINFPESAVNHKTDIHIPRQTVTIKDEKEIIKWFNGVFDEPKVELSLKADPTVNLGALTYHPDLDKTIRIPALNYLEGFGLIDLQFTLPQSESGHNMKGHLNLPNSGALTLSLGNLTFNMVAGDIKLGLVYINNTVLKPGDNSAAFDGDFYFDQLVPNLAAILDGQKDALSKGSLELGATGNSTMVNGEHINYIEQVLNHKHLKFQVPVLTLLGDVVSGLANSNSSGSDTSDRPALLDVFGDVFGNSSLIEQSLQRFGSGGQDSKSKTKRSMPGRSLVGSMLRVMSRGKLQ